MSEVADIFWGKPMRDRAQSLADIHPRMRDYLAQAPVIVPGTVGYKRETITRVMHHICQNGDKLRTFMSAFGLPSSLRHASGKGFKGGCAFLPVLRHANNSSVAQQIMRRPNAPDQRLYWEQLGRWQTITRYLHSCNSVPNLIWMAENLPPGDHDMSHYCDMFARRANWIFTRDWNWARFEAELHRWEDSFAKSYTGPDPNKALSPHKMPERVVVGGFSFVHLNTRATLAEEGSLMRHCVGGYYSTVANGMSCIYSVQGERRLATLQIGRKISGRDLIWEVQQLKGRCNSAAPKGVTSAATAFVSQVNAPP